MASKREAERKRYVRSRGGMWGAIHNEANGGAKVHEQWCRHALHRGYLPISANEVTADDVLCKVCRPQPDQYRTAPVVKHP